MLLLSKLLLSKLLLFDGGGDGIVSGGCGVAAVAVAVVAANAFVHRMPETPQLLLLLQ